MNRGVVLGVDGGGSKTHLALASADGRLLALESGPGTNLESQKPADISATLSTLLVHACKKADVTLRDIKASCFGLCGVDIREDVIYAKRQIIGKLGLPDEVKVHNDAFIGLFNDGFLGSGAVVTVGSGHKWLAVNGKREFMHDGLVFQGLKDMVMEELLKVAEGYTKASGFSSRMYRRFGFRSPDDFIRRWRYGGSRDYVKPIPAAAWNRITRVQELLGREAESGDSVALSIINAYAVSLADGTVVALRRVKASRPGQKVIMSGSVLVGIKPLRTAFARILKGTLPGSVVVPARFRPIRGALVYAGKMAWKGLPDGSLAENVLRYPGV